VPGVTRSASYSASTTGSTITTYDMDAAGIAVDDWAILTINCGLTTATWTPSLSGWTTLLAPTTYNTRRATILARKRLAGDPATFTMTCSGVNSQRGVLVGVSGAADVSTWITGTFVQRSGMGSDGFHNIIPGVTSTVSSSMILTVSLEATTADEGGAHPGVSGATEWVFVGQTGAGTAIETVGYYYLDQTAPGASGTVTTTYSNVQASNGAGITFAIPPAVVDASGNAVLTFTAAATASPAGTVSATGGANLTITAAASSAVAARATGNANLTVTAVGMAGTGYVGRWMALPLRMVAHRGGWASTLGEETLAAYTKSAGWNPDLALEMSVWQCSTGEWVLSHDRTTGRVFTGTDYDIPTTSWSTLSALRSIAGNNPIAKLDDLLPIFAVGNRVIFLDNKQQVSMPALLDILDSYGGKDRFVAKNTGPSTSWATAARARGYKGWGYYYPADLPAASGNSSWDMLGMTYGASASDWATIKGFGKPVLAHILDSAAAYVTAQAANPFGYMVSDILNVVPVAAVGNAVMTVTASATAKANAAGGAQLTITARAQPTIDAGPGMPLFLKTASGLDEYRLYVMTAAGPKTPGQIIQKT
jgi:hypothetical protein